MFLDSNLVLLMFLSLPLSLRNSLREENESTCCSSTSSSSPIPFPYHLFIVPLPHPYTCLSCYWRGLRSESGLFKFSSSSSPFDLLLNKRTLIQLIKTLHSYYSRSALGSTPFAVLLCPNVYLENPCDLRTTLLWMTHLLTEAHVTESLLTWHQSS